MPWVVRYICFGSGTGQPHPFAMEQSYAREKGFAGLVQGCREFGNVVRKIMQKLNLKD